VQGDRHFADLFTLPEVLQMASRTILHLHTAYDAV